jgi:hypothetical protein
LRKLNTEPSIGASHQVSVHLAKQLQRRRFLEIDQSETRMACGGHVYQRMGTKCTIFIDDTFQGCFLPSFDSFGKAVSEKKIV